VTGSEQPKTRSRYSRRGFLIHAGVGAGAVALSGGVRGAFAPRAQAARSATVATSATTFGRLFPDLPAFAPATERVKDALRALGAPGGPLDANDDLSKGPKLLITDLGLSVNNPNNPTHTAGVTFMGQFIDHDITFDTTSAMGVPTDPGSSPNGRTPSLDLDSVYGAGPVASPQLYDSVDQAKLRIDSSGTFEDLPRTSDGTNTAIIADPRNDEHLMIAGLQCAFILFHNNAVDWARANGYTDSAFEQARQLTTWHYHWLVLNEFLPWSSGRGSWTTCSAKAAASTSRGCAKASSRSSSRLPRTGSGTAWCGPHTAPISRATTATPSSRSSSTRRARGKPIQSISAAARALHAASSAGRRSSTSATAR